MTTISNTTTTMPTTTMATTRSPYTFWLKQISSKGGALSIGACLRSLGNERKAKEKKLSKTREKE